MIFSLNHCYKIYYVAALCLLVGCAGEEEAPSPSTSQQPVALEPIRIVVPESTQRDSQQGPADSLTDYVPITDLSGNMSSSGSDTFNAGFVENATAELARTAMFPRGPLLQTAA